MQTPIRNTSAGNIDAPYIYGAATDNTDMANCTAKGFRLPTSEEWYQAARYIDGTNYYPDTYASGADAIYNATTGGSDIDGDGDVQYTGDVAVYDTGSTAAVKTKSPNKLGLYDMSGNVWEWCFDSSGSYRVFRGGAWNNVAGALKLSEVLSYYPDSASYILGMRPVRTN